jgi:DNA sulfur modification protein DndD
MIIQEVKLSNFGLYGGDWTFELTPVPMDDFNRPIIVFRGNNGVGKTTFIEAIRLCLHGSLALGNRVSRVAYENYLIKRIHVPLNTSEQPRSAGISLLLDYVRVGRKHTYRIERSWQQAHGKLKEELQIWEDDEVITDLDTFSQKNRFLRELVPPRVAELFFFDGEKLQLLVEDESMNSLLADMVKMLLGLNLVEQLQHDLDIYLSRQMTHDNSAMLRAELEELTQRISTLEQELSIFQVKREAKKEVRRKTDRAIANQEQRIASEGSGFVTQLDRLKITHQELTAKIEVQRRQVQEKANGLMPFAISPWMCQLVLKRLDHEKEYEEAIASRKVLERMADKLMSPDFWADTDITIDEPVPQKMLSIITGALKEEEQAFVIDPDEVILRVSNQDRRILLNWISQSLDEIPQQFCQTISRLNALEDERKKIDEQLKLVPPDETLKPLVETLYRYNEELESLQSDEKRLSEQIHQAEYKLEEAKRQLRQLRQQILEHEQHNQRIRLAVNTQQVLDVYVRELSQKKIGLLEQTVTQRFNELCHKETLVDAIRIDPNTFEVTLHRQRQPFERNQLSAGEKQLLAVAIMWALREVSGVPLPVIVDTPLGRLDSDHRFNMLHNYFPRASHQVILLATDTEIDDEMLTKLDVAISHVYYLDYDSKQGKTIVRTNSSEKIPEYLWQEVASQ